MLEIGYETGYFNVLEVFTVQYQLEPGKICKNKD